MAQLDTEFNGRPVTDFFYFFLQRVAKLVAPDA